MPDWLADYQQRLKKKRSLIFNRCSWCSGVPYININNDIDKIIEGLPGTPAIFGGVPGVPESGAGNTGNTIQDRQVFPLNYNYFSKITPGTPGTPQNKGYAIARWLEALPAPTLAVLARLREHFTTKGYQGPESEALALVTLAELMKRKGGPVAMTGEEAGRVDELGRAVELVKEVFGPEVEQKPA